MGAIKDHSYATLRMICMSNFLLQYHRIYSPITFGKKYDPNGYFIRHFLPVLKGIIEFTNILLWDTFCMIIMNSELFHWSDMPKEYIYEPWTAPKSIQVKAKCVIGKDYPSPGECSNHINLKMHQADVQISLKSLPNFLVGWFNDNSLEQIYLAVHYSRLEPDLCVVKITSISETIDLLRHTF